MQRRVKRNLKHLTFQKSSSDTLKNRVKAHLEDRLIEMVPITLS